MAKDKKKKTPREVLQEIKEGRCPMSLFHPVIIATQAINQLKGEPIEAYLDIHHRYQLLAMEAEKKGDVLGLEFVVNMDELTVGVEFKYKEDMEAESEDDPEDGDQPEVPTFIKDLIEGVDKLIKETSDKINKGKDKTIDADDFLG